MCGDNAWVEMDLILEEGALRRCTNCDHLVSGCNQETHWHSMKEFEDPLGTQPGKRSVKRFRKRAKWILQRMERLEDCSAHEVALLDVACSSGAFLAEEKTGFRSQGVDPSSNPAQTAQQQGLDV